jgi:PAS domain S-box-containing protein
MKSKSPHHRPASDRPPGAQTQSSTEDVHSRTREDYWKQALQLSELRYRRLFETAQDGILILDANNGEIVDVNPFLLDLLDYPFEEMCGRKLWEIGQFKDIAANRSAFEKLQENEYIRYENLPLQRRDGSQVEVEFVSNVYMVEADKVIQCNIRDISARAEKRDGAATTVAALRLANATKDAWLLAHTQKLRAPLASLGSMLGLIALEQKLACVRQLSEQPSEFDEAAFQHVRRNFEELVRSFNELSDLTGQAPLQIEGNSSRRTSSASIAPPNDNS